MKLSSKIAYGFGLLMLGAAPAMAQQPAIYSYPQATANYCPAGLQPIVMGGVICCGTPNRGSYSDMMRHPAPVRKVKKHYTPRHYVDNCPAGVKGCN